MERSVRSRAAVAICALVALLATVRGSGATLPADRPIQPGARLTRPDIEPFGNRLPYKFYRCTLSFVFRDAIGRLYIGTTGESACIGRIGARAYDEHGVAFGTAVFREYSPPAGSFGLVRIDPARYGDVSPAVRYWGGPTGVAAPSEAGKGDIVAFTGHGFVEGDIPPIRPRLGILRSYDARHFTADSLAELGDSGAPMIEMKTGLAVGMISDFGTSDRPPTTDDGPSVIRILADLASRSFHLTLVTAPYSPMIYWR